VALTRAGFRPGKTMSWLHSEMTRHSARAIAEAGKELGRFDSRAWLRPFPFPTAVVVTTEDDAVPPAKQYELAAAIAADIFEAPVRHLDVGAIAPEDPTRIYNSVLLETLKRMRAAAA
jgi:3-oxoadipate enol-lactonase